jgi:CRP-like cAMP-binding protein
MLEEVAFGRMEEGLQAYLIEKSKSGSLETTHVKIVNDMGSSREVVSRLLKGLGRKGEFVQGTPPVSSKCNFPLL